MSDNLNIILQSELKLFEKSIIQLTDIFVDIKDINLESEMSKQELYYLDTLAVRFSRSFDLFENKILRTIYAILGETGILTSMDIYAKAERLKILENRRAFYSFKLLRNRIVHEYAEIDWIKIIQEIVLAIPTYLSASENLVKYSNSLINNPDYQ